MTVLRWLFVLLALAWPAAARAEDRCVQVREERAGDRFTLVARLEGCVEATITLTAAGLTGRASRRRSAGGTDGASLTPDRLFSVRPLC